MIWSAPHTRLVFDASEFWLQVRLVSRVVSQAAPPSGQSTVHAASVYVVHLTVEEAVGGGGGAT